MDGIIFDVDGTLWDSIDPVAKSWNMAINENSSLHVSLDRETLSPLFGKTMSDIEEILFPELPIEERDRLAELCFAYENRLLETEPGTLYAGVADTIKELSKKIDLYIVSNCQCGYIEVLLKTCGLEPYIKGHLCFGATNKPKGDTIRILMEQYNLKDVVYVGDTMGDYEACQKANVPFVYAEYGFGNVPEATTKIQAFGELLELFGK